VSFFLILPFLLFTRAGYHVHPLSFAALTLLPYLAVHVLFYLSHRRIFPQDRWGRLQTQLHMLFLAPSAIRARGLISSRIYSGFDYCSIAAARLKPEKLLPILRVELMGIDLALRRDAGGDLAEALRWRREGLRKLLRQAGLGEEEGLSPEVSGAGGQSDVGAHTQQESTLIHPAGSRQRKSGLIIGDLSVGDGALDRLAWLSPPAEELRSKLSPLPGAIVVEENGPLPFSCPAVSSALPGRR
jgi:hypothetical protein